MMLNLQDAKVGEVAIVSVAGRLDGAGAPEIAAHCNTLITGGATRLLLDMEGVDYISSAGVTFRCYFWFCTGEGVTKSLKPWEKMALMTGWFRWWEACRSLTQSPRA